MYIYIYIINVFVIQILYKCICTNIHLEILRNMLDEDAYKNSIARDSVEQT